MSFQEYNDSGLETEECSGNSGSGEKLVPFPFLLKKRFIINLERLALELR